MGWKRYFNAVIAAEVSSLSRFYDRLVQIHPLPEDPGLVFRAIRCPSKSVARTAARIPDCARERETRTVLFLNGTLNHHLDIQGLLAGLKPRLSRTSRLVAVLYNPYWAWVYRLANQLGLRRASTQFTFLTRTDLVDLAALAGYSVVRLRPVAYMPFRLLGLGDVVNAVLPVVPGVRWLALASVATLRPVIRDDDRHVLSVIIPARNERGNIAAALRRLPRLPGCGLEVVFVEGGSTDGTWEEIERVRRAWSGRGGIRVAACRQTGRGKNDAVREGFRRARGDLLVILDADLTMPPEMLGRFVAAYRDGLADFVNGSRLVYPMEGEAMRFLNRLANVFFAKALSHVLGTRLGDSLCGTKFLARHDARRITAWREAFGDFDPFGDFELLFPAAVLGLGVVDVPVAYRARTYGETNISRFRHGWMLLRMTLIGLARINTGRVP